MPIDPKGTTPGLVPNADEKPEPVHIRCKRTGCDSILAYDVTPPNPVGLRRYQCVKCGTMAGVATGGVINNL